MSFCERALDEILDFFDHQRIPVNTLEREKRKGEYRYYGAQGVIDYIDDYLFDGEYVLIAEDGANLVTRDQPIAFVVDGKFWVNNHAHIVRGKENEADNRYLCWLLNNLNIAGYVTGAAQPKLSQKNLRAIKVCLPPFPIQRRITEMLSAYDDLIENNLRRIALLEESARLLYREWFVRLRFPGHEHTRIIDGVPEGWCPKPLSELAAYLSRGITPRYDDEGESLVINQKCVRNRLLDLTKARRQSREFDSAKQLQVGDVLINSTGEGTLGRVAQVKSPIPNCTVDSHVSILRPKAEPPLHYFGMAVMELEPYLSTKGRGATNQTELSRSTIGESIIMIPPHSLVHEFGSLIAPISNQVIILIQQNQKLKLARDLLLPRLMRGEITV